MEAEAEVEVEVEVELEVAVAVEAHPSACQRTFSKCQDSPRANNNGPSPTALLLGTE